MPEPKNESPQNVHELLNTIQQTLNVPKSHYNEFGKFSFRSAEDILEAVKPLLLGASLILSDELVFIGNRYYVKATAKLSFRQDDVISNYAYAREDEVLKGMQGAQITGAASSYARKYALNGLFALDDTKDADTMDNTEKKVSKPAPKPYEDERAPVTREEIDDALGNPPEDAGVAHTCPVHPDIEDEYVAKGKYGPYWKHLSPDGTQICFGKGYRPQKGA